MKYSRVWVHAAAFGTRIRRFCEDLMSPGPVWENDGLRKRLRRASRK